MKTLTFLGLLAATAMAFTGCGGSQTVNGNTLPEWVMNPPEGCAVGISKFRGNLGLAKSSAVARGRDELARQLNTRVQGMVKDYQAQGDTDGKDFTEEMTRQVSRQVVDQSLSGTRARINQLGEGDPKQFYSLLCLDPEAFAGAFERMNTLDGRAKKALKRRAEVEFKDLDKQLEILKTQ